MTDFGRIKPPTPPASGGPIPRRRMPATGARVDRDGKEALFSAQAPPIGGVPLGALTVSCSSCRVTTTVTLMRAVFAAIPSVHLFLLRRSYPSWMQCPACDRRTWVRLSVKMR
ncbi:MAG: hypothetical protein ACT4QF_18125 [Sporichthyaceae bacterium]